jgi:hypothetical protein
MSAEFLLEICRKEYTLRIRRTLEDNIKTGVKIQFVSVDCIHLVKDRYQLRALVNIVMNLLVS